jgi:hypothetical protein
MNLSMFNSRCRISTVWIIYMPWLQAMEGLLSWLADLLVHYILSRVIKSDSDPLLANLSYVAS